MPEFLFHAAEGGRKGAQPVVRSIDGDIYFAMLTSLRGVAPALRRRAAPLLSVQLTLVDDFTQDVLQIQELEASFATQFADVVVGVREAIFTVAEPFRDSTGIGNIKGQITIAEVVGELRELVQLLLLQERVLGIGFLACAIIFAVGGGLLLGDRVSPKENVIEGQDLFRTDLGRDEAAAFDEGISASVDPRAPLDTRVAADECQAPRRIPRPSRAVKRAISPGLWFELILCIAIDVAGDASLFYPTGEVFDVFFAFVGALFIELFFDWPRLALFALWEELLPFTDIVPTATIGWLLVVVLGLRPQQRDRAALLRGPVDSDMLGPGIRPPIADRESYQPPPAYLVEGSRPWEEV